MYQIGLTFGLSDYIQYHPRTNLFHQNKEGILSSIGYLALYLYGSQLGSAVLKSRKNLSEWRSFTFKLLILDVFLWILLYFSNNYIQLASRRMVKHRIYFLSFFSCLVHYLLKNGIRPI